MRYKWLTAPGEPGQITVEQRALDQPCGISVSVVVCAYSEDRWPLLQAAVDSLRWQTLRPNRIVLVVDYNPALYERARAAFADVLVIENSQPPGLAGARNCGLGLAGGDVVAFLDDDAAAQADWLERLMMSYGDPQVVGVGGRIDPDWVARPAWFPAEFGWVVGCTYTGMPLDDGEPRNLIGANMSFRRSVLVDNGGFRIGVGQSGGSMLRCEDTEFCIRLRQRNPRTVLRYDSAAVVRHRVPPERSTFRYFVRRCYTEGQAKALITSLVGTRVGLASERAYVRKTLPRAVVRDLANGLVQNDLAALRRAGAIVVGFTLTAVGYLVGSLSSRRAGSLASPEVAASRGSS